MIKVINLTKQYGKSIIINNLNIQFPASGLYCILGNSGCGKSTLINCLSSLDLDFEGEIYIDDLSLKVLSDRELRELRRTKFGFIFQSFNLFEKETVFDNIKLVAESKNKALNNILNDEIDDLLNKLGIFHLKNEFVSYLSGGEKQRVAIARALINKPEIIFCDEPTGSLDLKNSEEIFQILQEISYESLVIVVTHDKKLAKSYSNFILNLNTYELKVNKSPFCKKVNKIKHSLPPHLSFSYMLNSIKDSIKSNKSRFVVTNSIFSISLLCLGLTLFISNNIEKGIKKAFSSLISDKSLILKKKSNTSNLQVTSLNQDKVLKINEKYKNDISYVGTKFLFNYKEFFPERSNFYYEYNNLLKNFTSLSVNSINEFHYLTSKELDELKFYPNFNDDLKDDEIVASLNYKQMEDLCLNLRIERTFESLGNYLKEKPLRLILKTKNSSWNYEDEQVFFLKSVIIKPSSEIFHTNNFFNQVIFNKFMKMPSSLEIYSKHDLPWIMNQIYYLKTKIFPNYLVEKIQYDNDFQNIIFEPDNIDFSPYTFKENEAYNSYKIFLLETKEDIFKTSIIKDIQKRDSSFNNYYFSTPGGYMNYGGSLFNGFAKEMFFSSDKNKLKSLENILQKVDVNDYESASFKDEIARGFSLDTSQDNVKYSIQFDGEYEGSKDFSIKNIAISTGLAKRLSSEKLLNKDLYMMFNYETVTRNNYHYKKFKIAKFKIIGLVHSNAFKIYNNKDFSISLFRDVFGVSSLDLIPDSVVFEFDKKPKKETISAVNSHIKDYEIIDPFEDINSNINDVLKYFDYGLIIATIISGISSLLLMFVVSSINFENEKKDIAIYTLLGTTNSQIKSLQLLKCLSYYLPSIISSIFTLGIVGYFLSKVINQQIGLEIGFQFPWQAVLGILGLSIFLIFISFLVANYYLKKVKLTEELHKMT